jgi:hypothetical protein
MQSRIRYEYSDELPGVGVSKQRFVINGKHHLVVLNTEEMYFEIQDLEGNVIHKGGDDITNLHVLKRHVKRALMRHGCVFKTEERNRDYGLVKKENTTE